MGSSISPCPSTRWRSSGVKAQSSRSRATACCTGAIATNKRSTGDAGGAEDRRRGRRVTSAERMAGFPGRLRARRLRRLGVLNRGISRAKMPCVRTLLCEPGLGLKLSRPVQSAFISRALSLDQIFGGLPPKEASGFKADNACVRMSSDVLDHGTPCGGCNQFVRDLEAHAGEFVGGSPHNSAGVLRPSI